MYQTNEPINHEQLPETFAKFFSEKNQQSAKNSEDRRLSL